MVLIVIHLFHPIDRLAVELLLNGDMGHCLGGRRSMPMLLTGPEPDHIAWTDLFDLPSPTLHPAETGGDNQCLTKGMRMPR